MDEDFHKAHPNDFDDASIDLTDIIINFGVKFSLQKDIGLYILYTCLNNGNIYTI